jgi:hypothetical protein
MSTIFDKIKYDHKRYSQLMDPVGKQAIEKLAALLKPIETEIVNDPDGRITIDKSGYIYIDSFRPDVASKLTKILAGRKE